MKLLVLAHTPPPLHGQSVMVKILVEGLPREGIAVHHVNVRLSRDAADIGRWRMGKLFATFGFGLRAIAARFRHGCDTLYYVPAPPGKRSALYRDGVLMLLCRPFFRRLILHWHAAGLGGWLEADATRFEHILSQALLGRADLAIAVAQSTRLDAKVLRPRRVAVVPNGVADPGPLPPAVQGEPFRLLFLGQCSETKGLFAAAAAVIAANRQRGAAAGRPAFALTAAGPFESAATAARFHELERQSPFALRYAGVASETGKRRLFAVSHALLFPSTYPAEGLPLVLLEALAHDRPIVATHWRGIPEVVAPEVGRLVPPHDPDALTAALLDLQARPPAAGVCRARFLAKFTRERHLAVLAAALRDRTPPGELRPLPAVPAATPEGRD
jgi:glycosyltransferase involved in cell wall biosynthesis